MPRRTLPVMCPNETLIRFGAAAVVARRPGTHAIHQPQAVEAIKQRLVGRWHVFAAGHDEGGWPGWIEGKRLLSAGHRREAYACVIDGPDVVVITLCTDGA